MKKIYKDGMYDLTNSDYHNSSGYSRSQLLSLRKSPKQFKYDLTNPKETSAAMNIGTVVHMMVLEPECVVGQVAIAPKVNKRTKDGKQEWIEFQAAHEAHIVLSAEEYELCESMSNALSIEIESVFTWDFMSKGQVEKSLYFTEPGGIQLKARPDFFNKGIVIDVKTCRDASHRAFQNAAIDGGYFLQAAMQKIALKSCGEEFEKFIFLCVENTAPFNTAVYLLDDEAISFGQRQLENCIDKLAVCLDSGKYESLGIQALTVPGWAQI